VAVPIRVVLEAARKRAFASAIDWPGWSRAGRTPEQALEALVGAGGDLSTDELRAAFRETIRLRATGAPLPEPSRVRAPWPPRYAVRRSAWHALDHAWEIEGRLEA
jgi:hypothetical protein